ncbi:hypothetical protein [Treponema pedis]|uniref:hypothetical protein n=1 Tax=Treponema pedis TaxID=409322 RepID=UPI003D20978D
MQRSEKAHTIREFCRKAKTPADKRRGTICAEPFISPPINLLYPPPPPPFLSRPY